MAAHRAPCLKVIGLTAAGLALAGFAPTDELRASFVILALWALFALVLIALFALAEAEASSGTRASARRWFFPRPGDPAQSAFSTLTGVMDALFGPSPVGPGFVLTSFVISLSLVLGGLALTVLAGNLPVSAVETLLSLPQALGRDEATEASQLWGLAGLLVVAKLLFDFAAWAGVRLVGSLARVSKVVEPVALLLGILVSPIALIGFTLVANSLVQNAGFSGDPMLEMGALADRLGVDPLGGLTSLVSTLAALPSAMPLPVLGAALPFSYLAALMPSMALLVFLLLGPLAKLLFRQGSGLSALGRLVGAERRPIAALGYAAALVTGLAVVALLIFRTVT